MRAVPTASVESRWNRNLFVAGAVLALAYAVFAGLHTVDDFDTGWQIATGRYIIQQRKAGTSVEENQAELLLKFRLDGALQAANHLVVRSQRIDMAT